MVPFSTKEIRPRPTPSTVLEISANHWHSRDAEFLVSSVGTHLSTLAREIEKLALLVGERKQIVAADIAVRMYILAEEGLWELTAGLAEANPERLASVTSTSGEGVAPHQLMGQSMATRILLTAKADLERDCRSGCAEKASR